MEDGPGLSIVKFSRHYDRSVFDSGNQEIDHWLRNFASQQEISGVSRTYFLVNMKTQEILGFSALGVGHYYPSFRKSKSATKYGLRMVELFRLAIDQKWQGHGYARLLLRESLQIAIGISEVIGIQGVVVQPKSEELIHFYEKFGFEQFRENPIQLAIGIKVLRKAGKLYVQSMHVQEAADDRKN
jgi:GNAT superfamily N-acetyltransferase